MRILLGCFLFIIAISIAFLLAGLFLEAFDLEPEKISAITVSLVALISIVSGFTALGALNLEHRRSAPYPYPTFDTVTRGGLVLLRVKNYGPRTAEQVRILWDEPELRSQHGTHLPFTAGENSKPATLPPGESIAAIIGVSTDFPKKGGPMTWKGKIFFHDLGKPAVPIPFELDGRSLEASPIHGTDSSLAAQAIQCIPRKLDPIKKIADELEEIRKRQDQSPT